MAQTNLTFRVFVSSTFEDFEAERNALEAYAFPALRERCEARGARFQAVDLRWGVSEEASRDQLAMQLCLQEIARCRQLSPRPNFIALLGNRYGWRPLPSEVPDGDFTRILAEVERRTDRRLLAEWYRRDDNAVPPVWILQPRRGRDRDAKAWRVVEHRLQRVLFQAAKRSGLEGARLLRYGASAAHQEIAAGVLGRKDARSHVSTFIRSIGKLPAPDVAGGFLDLTGDGHRDREAQRALARLRQDITDRLPERNVFRFSVRWTGEGITTDHLSELCRNVERSLWRVMEKALDAFAERDPLDVEIAAHRAFAEERRLHFIGRTAARKEIAAYVAGSGRIPLIVRGVAGSGKSSLMAQAAADASESGPGGLVVSRFIGATAASTASSRLLRGICDELSRAYGREQTVSADYQALVSHFQALLARGSRDRPVILFLDALDQLRGSDPATQLDWLPLELPTDARVVLSTLSPGQAPVSRPLRVLELGPMADEEGAELLERWLHGTHRTLTEDQRRMVLGRFADCPLPLYLRLAFEEARWWASHESPPELAAETTGLIEDLLARLGDEAGHGQVLVAHSLGYLAAAKNGLTEDELVEALSLDTEVMEDFSLRSPESPATDRLPPIVWSRLYSDLDPYLSQRSADGTSTLGFYHRQLGDVVARNFLSGRSRLARTRQLARFFEAQPNEALRDEHRAPNLRKLSELPFLQTRAALWGRLERTLCDLDFIRAKCAAGLTYDLVEDYAAAARALPESRQERREADDRAGRMSRYADELEEYARNREAGVPDPQPPAAARPSTADERSRRSLRSVKGTSRADRIEAFARFVNAESHRLGSLVQYPCYLVQQAYNAGHAGPLALAAEEHVDAACRTAPALLLRPWSRPEPEPHPPIVRTFDSSCAVDGGVVAMTPHGRRAVSNSEPGFRVWDVATGRLISAIDADQGWVGAVAITASGELAVTGSGDNTVRIWDTDTGQCLKVLRGHTDRPAAVSVTPDGGLVVSGGSSDDPSVRIWDPVAASCLRTLSGHEGAVQTVAVTADGSRLVSGSEDTTVRVWDLASGRCLKVLRAHRDPLRSVAATPDGRRMVSCGDEGRVILWDLERGRRLRTLGSRPRADARWGSGFSGVAITADGQFVLGANRAGVRVWDAETGDVVSILDAPSGTVSAIEHVAATADGSLALTGSYNGVLSLWDVTHGYHEFTEDELFTGNVSSVSFTADGRDALVTGDDGALFINTRTRRVRQSAWVHAGGTRRGWEAAAISADGARILATGTDGNIAIYRSLRRLHTLEASDGYLSTIEVGQDGRQLLTGGEDKTLRLWDLETRRLRHEFAGHPDPVNAAAIAPDGILAVSGSGDDLGRSSKTLLLWNLKTGRRIKILKGHGSPVYCLAIAPDGRRFVSGGLDPALRVWDAHSGDCVRVLEGHTEEVVSVAVTADGRNVISGSRDQTVRVWNLDTGRCVAVAGLRFVVTTLGLSGRDLIVGGQAGNVPEFELRDPMEGTGRTTLGYQYDYARRGWETEARANCPWCGRRFAPPLSVSAAIESITRDLEPAYSPCLRLPDDAFDEAALLSACTRCKDPVLFNPFVLDTRGFW